MIVVLAMDFEGNLWSSDDDVTSNGWCSRDEVSPVEGGEPGTNVISLDSSGFMVTVNVGISNAGICKWKMAGMSKMVMFEQYTYRRNITWKSHIHVNFMFESNF